MGYFKPKHGLSNSPEYRVWHGMRRRCKAEPNYAGRGVKVCQRWDRSFTAFYEDMGPRPSDRHSIDRIDPHGDYEPGNCRWTTMDVQHKNKRDDGGKGGRPRQSAPSPSKLDAELTLRMAAEGRSAGDIAFAHAQRGVQVSRQAVSRFLKRWQGRTEAA